MMGCMGLSRFLPLAEFIMSALALDRNSACPLSPSLHILVSHEPFAFALLEAVKRGHPTASSWIY